MSAPKVTVSFKTGAPDASNTVALMIASSWGSEGLKKMKSLGIVIGTVAVIVDRKGQCRRGGDKCEIEDEKKTVFLSLTFPAPVFTSACTVAKPESVEKSVTLANPKESVIAWVELSTPTSERFVKVTGVFGTTLPFPSRTFASRNTFEFVWTICWTDSNCTIDG